MPKNLDRLKALLEDQETFPCQYLHKFVGYNTEEFLNGVQGLEKKFSKLKQQSERTSRGEAHIAFTFVLQAENSEEILELVRETGELPGLIMIL